MCGHKIAYKQGETIKELKKSLRIAKKAKGSVLYIIPTESHEVSLFEFQKGDVSKAIQGVYDTGVTFRHWYIE